MRVDVHLCSAAFCCSLGFAMYSLYIEYRTPKNKESEGYVTRSPLHLLQLQDSGLYLLMRKCLVQTNYGNKLKQCNQDIIRNVTLVGYIPTVMAPTTKPWAATRMWIRWTDIFVSPRFFILYSLYPTMAKNPAIPGGSRKTSQCT